MRITIDKVKQAVREKYGWDDSPVLYINFPGQSSGTGGGDTIDYLTVDEGQIVLDVNEEGEVYGVEFL